MTATALEQASIGALSNSIICCRHKAKLFLRALPDLLLPAADLVMPSSNVALNRLMHIKIINDSDQTWLLVLLRLVLLRLVDRA